MAKYAKLSGMERVNANLRREINKIKGMTMTGLIESAILIRRSMDKSYPKIPVDTKNLRGSWFTDEFMHMRGPTLLMGFTANYAAHVHEMTKSKKGKKINWNRRDSGPKFFEAHLLENRDEILRTIRKHAKIK